MLPLAIDFPQIDPNAFVIPGLNLPIRWYALAYIAGLLAGWQIIVALMKAPRLWGGQAPMPAKQVEDLLTWVIVGVILGGRLGFVLFYDFGWYLAHPLEIFMVWKGGMAFHGGFLGVVVAVWLYCRRHGLAVWSIGDAAALVAPIGLLLGRIANFIKPELWGHPTDMPWGVIFPGEAAQTCLGLAGQVDGMCARHPSQLYEGGLEGIVLGILLWILVSRGLLRRPGGACGIFLIGYGCSRAFVELFRQADPQFVTPTDPMGYVVQFGQYGLSMGQLLSLPMIAIGIVLVLRALRRPKVGAAA
ncbi:prolipoprotein diacylglyceryl transferase [Thioclava sp. GXIMD4216]|uniref:prolipoprotein diacylglyceryl transferase n=1 Tax=unclassified Thioclava TaxID=2621713 RepID=UPI0030CF3043